MIAVRRLQLDASGELNVPGNTVWKILRFTLRKRPYHIQVLHHLEDEDFACRRAMCYDLLETVENENLMETFYSLKKPLSMFVGKSDRHSSQICAHEEAQEVSECERDTPKVIVC